MKKGLHKEIHPKPKVFQQPDLNKFREICKAIILDDEAVSKVSLALFTPKSPEGDFLTLNELREPPPAGGLGVNLGLFRQPRFVCACVFLNSLKI